MPGNFDKIEDVIIFHVSMVAYVKVGTRDSGFVFVKENNFDTFMQACFLLPVVILFIEYHLIKRVLSYVT